MKPNMKTNKTSEVFAFLIVILLGQFTFFMGWHNIDLAFNLMRLDSNPNQIIDESAIGNRMTLKELYMNGMSLILIGLFVSMFGVFLLGNRLISIS